MALRFSVLLACFFLSGLAGLIYEIVWLRMLGLIFGHTVYAITTVLAAFMAGLTLGSFLFARFAGRIRNLLSAYGILEIGIGAYSALIPGLLWLSSFLYLGLHRLLSFSYDAFSFVQFLVVFAVLLVPTTLMGGTLPVLSQALVRGERGLGRMVGTLYAVNTFGAVLGVVAAGYVLLPALGNRGAIAVAGVLNIAVGLAALAYGRSVRRAGAGETAPGPAESPSPKTLEAAPVGEPRDLGAWLTVAALGVSGAVSMVYEVAWTRALALVIGSSTYAFTAMLVAFLVGIAGGSAVYSWIWGARRHQRVAFALIQAGIAGAVVLTLLVFERMPELFLLALRRSDSPAFVQVVQLAVSAAVLLPSTLLIGATFPCAVAVAAHAAARVGRDVGHVYAVNTLGAIVGTVVAGFVLIPAIGVHTSIKVGIAVNLLLAGLVLVSATPVTLAWRWGTLGAALAAVVGLSFIPPWDTRVMASGAAIYAKEYLKRTTADGVARSLRQGTILFYRDGPSATVTVQQSGENLLLQVNGKTDASFSPKVLGDMPTQVLSGHLGLLLHPDPKTVLVVGLGGGVTAGAAARHPIERLDIAEIEPAVVAANSFFAAANGDVLHNPKVRTVIADARNFLLTTPNRYDVIISEPSNPWIGGIASLFSVEFFELAKARLRPGGIMVQWIHAYSLLPDDLRMVVTTFREVFPATMIWQPTGGDYLLVGRAAPAPVDLDLLKRRFETDPAVARDLGQIGARSWASVLGYFALDEADSKRYTEDGRLNTDDRLPLEFSAPRSIYLNTVPQNWQLMRSFKRAELPEVTAKSRAALDEPDVRFAIGATYLSYGAGPEALVQFHRALERDPRHLPSLLGAAETYLKSGRYAEGFDLARRAMAVEPRSVGALYLAGLAADKLGRPEEAVELLERGVALHAGRRADQPSGSGLDSRTVATLMRLGEMYEARKDFVRAGGAYERALALDPRSAPPARQLIRLFSEHGQGEAAAAELAARLKQAASADPFVSAYLGWAFHKRGLDRYALPLLAESAAKLPDEPVVQYQFGVAAERAGDKETARRALARAVSAPESFPEKDEARRLLAQLK
jgi:spermidine synthase